MTAKIVANERMTMAQKLTTQPDGIGLRIGINEHRSSSQNFRQATS
jgi:hypothetical protein